MLVAAAASAAFQATLTALYGGNLDQVFHAAFTAAVQGAVMAAALYGAGQIISFMSKSDLAMAGVNFKTGAGLWASTEPMQEVVVTAQRLPSWWKTALMATGTFIAKHPYVVTAAIVAVAIVTAGAALPEELAVAGAAEEATSAARVASAVFRTAHYADRLTAAGVDAAKAEAAIASDIGALEDSLSVGAAFSGRLTIDEVLLEYRAYPLPGGLVNVGTIFPVGP